MVWLIKVQTFLFYFFSLGKLGWRWRKRGAIWWTRHGCWKGNQWGFWFGTRKWKWRRITARKSNFSSLNKWATKLFDSGSCCWKMLYLHIRSAEHCTACVQRHLWGTAFLNPECLTVPAFSRPPSLRLLRETFPPPPGQIMPVMWTCICISSEINLPLLFVWETWFSFTLNLFQIFKDQRQLVYTFFPCFS